MIRQPSKTDGDTHRRFISNASAPTRVTADFRCRQPSTSTADAIAVRRDQLAELRDPFIRRARRASDVEHVVELKDVAAVDRRGSRCERASDTRPRDGGDGIDFADGATEATGRVITANSSSTIAVSSMNTASG